MEKKIDKIILKAEAIKEFLVEQDKPKGNIEQLIECLKSYRDTVGDIGSEKRFYISGKGDISHCGAGFYRVDDVINFEMPIYRFEFQRKDYKGDIETVYEPLIVYVKCLDWTTYIRESVVKPCSSANIYSLPPETIENSIADAVWDVQTFRADNPYLMAKLINKGLKPTTDKIKWVCDFK